MRLLPGNGGKVEKSKGVEVRYQGIGPVHVYTFPLSDCHRVALGKSFQIGIRAIN